MRLTAMEEQQDGFLVPGDRVAERLDSQIEYLERLSRQSGTAPVVPAARSGLGPAPLLPQEIERELRFLRQLSAGIARADPGEIWFDRAGYGSVLLVREIERRKDRFHKLVTHRLDPLDAAQISLSSDLGRALTGRRPHDELEVRDAWGTRRLRIVMLKTLPARLGMRASAG